MLKLIGLTQYDLSKYNDLCHNMEYLNINVQFEDRGIIV